MEDVVGPRREEKGDGLMAIDLLIDTCMGQYKCLCDARSGGGEGNHMIEIAESMDA